jgi:WD40 repeat protein
MSTPDNYDLFLSYADADHGWILGFLAPALDAAGLRYTAEATGDSGAAGRAALDQAARKSRHGLLILSPDYLCGNLDAVLAVLRRVYGSAPDTWPVTALIHRHVPLPAALAGLSVADATDPLTESGVLQVLAEELLRTIPAVTPPAPTASAPPASPLPGTPVPIIRPPAAQPPPPPARSVTPPPPPPRPIAPTPLPALRIGEDDEDAIWPRVAPPQAAEPPSQRADISAMPGLEDDAASRAANAPPPRPLLPAGFRRFRRLIFWVVVTILIVFVPTWGSLTRSLKGSPPPTLTPTVAPAVIATQQAQLAPAQYLAAQALGQRPNQPAVSLLLAVEAYRITDTVTTRNALFTTVLAHAVLTAPGTLPALGQVFTYYSQPISHLAVSENGQLLAGAAADHTVVVWNTSTRQPIGPPLTGYSNQIEVVRFSAGDWLTTLSRDDKIIGWDLDQHPPATITVKNIHGSLYALNPITSPDDRLEAILTDAGDAQVSRRFGSQLGVLSGIMQGKIDDVTFSPDSRMLATAGSNGTIRLWDAATLAPIDLPFTAHSGATLSVAFAPNNTLLSSGADGMCRAWDAGPTLWIQDACAGAGRNLTSVEWQQFLPDQPYRRTCPTLP